MKTMIKKYSIVNWNLKPCAAAAVAIGILCVTLAGCGGGSGGSGGAASSSSSVVWTWTGGANSITQADVAGPPDVSSVPFVTAPAQGGTGFLAVNQSPPTGGATSPSARAASASWTDSSGNSYVFGGVGFDSGGASGYLNDLWKYNASAGQWSLVAGSSPIDNPGVYGTKGTGSASNIPGSREEAASFLDAQGNLWLFGGAGFDSAGNFGLLNDLWEYDPAAATWTWVAGSNTVDASGVYGTLGTGAVGNTPGARASSVAWVDSSGDFWLFGGVAFDSSGALDTINDLWKFSGGEWTWAGGSNSIDAPGVYGTLGTPAAGNVPGARSGATAVAISGSLWLVSGVGFDSAGNFGGLNDAWNYNPATGQWTWVSGAKTVDAIGVYGTKGIAAAANVPGARAGANSWTDKSGSLFLFGGAGLDSAGDIGSLNDVWKYRPSSGKWIWVGGSNTIDAKGAYGSLGTASKSNTPGARSSAIGLSDSLGNHRIVGGLGIDSNGSFGYLSDFWNN